MYGIISVRLHGYTLSAQSAHTRQPGERGEITGWSVGAATRNTHFLQSVDPDELGYDSLFAVTLTVPENPETAADFHAMRRALVERLRRLGLVRLHWVIEWTRRGTAHLHMCIQMPYDWTDQHLIALWWTQICAKRGIQASIRAQHVESVYDPVGWLRYVGKHASRGVRHYQRAGRPSGWTKTGRLWGKIGDWPIAEPGRMTLTRSEFFRLRRLIRDYQLASARRRGDSLAAVRIAKVLSSSAAPTDLRALSGWANSELVVSLLQLALASGTVHTRFDPSEVETVFLGVHK